MAKKPGVIPISDARDIGMKSKCPLVVIFAIEEDVTRFTVTTWGRNKALCKVAAGFGDQFREAIFDGDVVPPPSPDGLPDEPTVTHCAAKRSDYMPCDFCENGELWTECCNGSSGCACEGKQVFYGQCRVCDGMGRRSRDADTEANLRAIRTHAEATGGYLGNPYGRLR